MKKNLLLFILAIMCANLLVAQTPPFYNSNTSTVNNNWPLNTTSSNDKVDFVYAPGEFTGAPNGNIDTLCLRCGTDRAGGAGPYPSFEVSMGQTIGTSTTVSTSFFTGLTSVFASASYTTPPISTSAPQDGWIAIPLSTPFSFDAAKTLIVEIKSLGSNNANGTFLRHVTTATDRRVVGSYANATGTTFTSTIEMGLSVSPPPPVITPPFYNSNTSTVNNNWPLNTTSSNDKVDFVYAPGEFTGAPNGNIDTLWLRCGTDRAGGAGPYPSFEVSMGQTIGTSTTVSTSFFTGLTSVFASASYTTPPISTSAPQDGWIAIPLSTPFSFDAAKTLIVEIKSLGSNNANGTFLRHVTTATDRRVVGSYANATGTTFTSTIEMGLSISPNAPLPLVFGAFTVRKLKTANLVEWTTKYEHNNSHFGCAVECRWY